MTKATIWKYETKGGKVVFKEADTDIEVPVGATALSAGLDPQGKLCVWMLLHPEYSKERRRIYVRGTGHDCSDVIEKGARFVGTVVQPPYVWHVFIDFLKVK